MLTLLLILGIVSLLFVITLIVMGAVALSPVVLLILLFPALDVIVVTGIIKGLFGSKKKDE